MKRNKLYRITWKDITTDNVWRNEEELDKWVKTELVVCVSEWRFLKQVDEWLLFYSGLSQDKDPQYYDIHCLPKGVIKKITEIKTK